MPNKKFDPLAPLPNTSSSTKEYTKSGPAHAFCNEIKYGEMPQQAHTSKPMPSF